MNSDSHDPVAHLRTHSSRLNQITDSAAEAVRQVEDFLNEECSLGVPAEVEVRRSGPDDDHFVYMGLAYERFGARFRIIVVYEGDEIQGYGDDGRERKPWSDCSRDEKLQSIPKLPALIAAISASMDAKLAEAETAISGVRGLLASLKISKEAE